MFGHVDCMDLSLSLSTCFVNPLAVLVSKQCFIVRPGLTWTLLIKESVQLVKSLFWGNSAWWREALVGVSCPLFHENSKRAASFRETNTVSQAEELGCDTDDSRRVLKTNQGQAT